MSIYYEVLANENVVLIKDLCNELMKYQKSKSYINSELFNNMNFDTRMILSMNKANENYIVISKDGDNIVGYVYSNISFKEVYSNDFDTFFNLDSVENKEVGCLSQFYIREDFRSMGIGTVLFNMSMNWLKTFKTINDIFIFVSNGNDNALKFYLGKGFKLVTRYWMVLLLY